MSKFNYRIIIYQSAFSSAPVPIVYRCILRLMVYTWIGIMSWNTLFGLLYQQLFVVLWCIYVWWATCMFVLYWSIWNVDMDIELNNFYCVIILWIGSGGYSYLKEPWWWAGMLSSKFQFYHWMRIVFCFCIFRVFIEALLTFRCGDTNPFTYKWVNSCFVLSQNGWNGLNKRKNS